MNINPDDPKWTAYVLGELNDQERTQVEQQLESSQAAREVVEEIRVTTALLQHELAEEQHLGLTARQRSEVTAASLPQQSPPMFRWAAVAASLAAAVLVMVTLWTPALLRSRQAAETSLPAVTPAPQPPFDQGSAQREVSAPHEAPALGHLRQQGQQGQQPQQSGARDGVFEGAAGAFRTETFSGVSSFSELKRSDAPLPPATLADRQDQPRRNTEAYDFISDNAFIRVAQDPLATFSIDVDTASYANMRRFLTMNQMPPRDSVRIEEMINYFTYDYPSPTGRHPIAAYTEVADAPWTPEHRLVRIGVKAREIDASKRPPSNLVFLIDVSGSMATPEKLPMLKNAMKLLVERLREGDHVAIVTYAGASGLQLPSTPGDRKQVINAAIENLGAGGSTNGAAGIHLAYDTAMSRFIAGGVNRVVLATDGDFNVGVTSEGDLVRLIEEKAQSGVFLSVLGFGMGNYKDSTLEKLADKGNGNYAYIDTLSEARKVLVEQMSGTLMTVAKDVKIQIEFDPNEVNAYRLIGYENRALRHQDFNDDQKDAGDIGAGHTVTALFEVVPRGIEVQIAPVDTLKYQQPAQPLRRSPNGEILNLKIRYKAPDGNASHLIETPVLDRSAAFNSASADFRFAAAVASFGMILRGSPYKGQSTIDAVIEMAERSKGTDTNGYRDEFVRLARRAREMK